MYSVRHVHPARSLFPRLRRGAIGLVLAACGASLPSLAGQASASFGISIQLLPEGAGTCTASATTGAPQVTCRPSVVGGTSGAGGGGGGERQGGSTLLGYRTPDTHLKLAKLAGGELVEVGTENFHAWAEDNSYAQGEYSSRLVMAGGVPYVEMTVSW
jgi:hypothetical protein